MRISESQLKSLIKHIIVEALAGRMGEEIEPVIQKTPNQNHEFDAGRTSVMKAVNVAENEGDSQYQFKNGDRVRLKPQYAGQSTERNEIFTLSQWDGKRGWIGDKSNRGWYVRGYQIIPAKAAKKSFKENEEDNFPKDLSTQSKEVDANIAKMEKDPSYRPSPFNSPEQINPLETYKQEGFKCGKARDKKDQGLVTHIQNWFNNAIKLEKGDYAVKAREAFNQGYREGSGANNPPQYFKEKVGMDGRYQDDMESGMKSNKMMGMTENNGDGRPCPCGSGLESWWEEDARGIPLARVCNKCKQEKLKKYRPDVLNNPNYEADEPIEPEDDLYEETGTGAVAGYSTPFAFSKKNKMGSGRAISAAKKYGKVVKSISEKK